MRDKLIRNWKILRQSNWVLTAAVVALLVIGVLFIYSACYISDDADVRPLYRRQLVWAVAGAVGYVVFSVVDYRRLKRGAWSLYGGCIALLVLVLLVGRTVYGARRWLMIFGDSGFGIQPSELAKLGMIVLLSSRLSEAGRDLRRPGEVMVSLLLALLPMVLIVRQPDLGTAMVLVPTAIILMFVAGVPFRYVGALTAGGLLLAMLLLAALFLPARFGANAALQARIAGLTGLSDYQQGRIEVFIHPEKDPLGAGWNKRQSEIAVGSGGLKGKGYLQGTQNILGFLPRSVAPTDFIYSVIAEEKGFAGSVTVLALFAVIIATGLHAALRTLDPMGRLLCTGVIALLFSHVFINVAMTIGLMPITGLPLPLISYGGSFTMVIMLALGMVQSVYIRSDRRETYR